jgi:hypothetical protein
MDEATAAAFRDWHDFYLLIGTASATLVGLTFVAVSVGSRYFTKEREAGLKSFLTPIVMHFSAVLMTCLFATAPSRIVIPPSVFLLATGLVGIGYSIHVWIRMSRGGFFRTIDLEDRFWYVLAPLTSYLVMTFSAGVVLWLHVGAGLDLIGLSLIMLLLLSIRNAWDMTVWIVIRTD